MKSPIIHDSELKITQKALEDGRLSLIPKRSVLIVARSGILKRELPVCINEVECTINQDLKVLVTFVPGLERYLQIALKGCEAIVLADYVKTGTTVQSLKYSDFELFPVPLPPLAEQHRIVQRVDELMVLCDQLEATIEAQQHATSRLLDALIAEVLADSPEPQAVEAGVQLALGF